MYAVLSGALFDAVISGDDATAASLFPVALAMAGRPAPRGGRRRQPAPPVNRLLHTTAPLTDMMLISGYAMFLFEFDGRGIWLQARQAWDEVTESPQRNVRLVAELEARQRTATGDMRRWRWTQAFDRWLVEHGLEPLESARFPRQRDSPGHASPVVVAVLSQRGLANFVMANLFLLDYLLTRLGVQGVRPGRSTRDLHDALQRARQDRSEQ